MKTGKGGKKIHYLLEAKEVASDKYVLLTARYIHSLAVASPGTGRKGKSFCPHEEVMGCTRSGEKQEESETIDAAPIVHNMCIVGLERKISLDSPYSPFSLT